MLLNKAGIEPHSFTQEIDLTGKHPVVYANGGLVVVSSVCQLADCKIRWDSDTNTFVPFIALHNSAFGNQPYIYDSQIYFSAEEDGLQPKAVFDASYLSYLLLNPIYRTVDLAADRKKTPTIHRYTTFLKFPNLLMNEDYGLVNPVDNTMQLHPIFPFCVASVPHSELGFKDIIRNAVQQEYLETLRARISQSLIDDRGLPNPNIVKGNSKILLNFANKIASKGINISTALLGLYLSILQKHKVQGS